MFVSINGKEKDLEINDLREYAVSAIYTLKCRKVKIEPGDGKITTLLCFESQRCNFPLEIEHFTFLWRIAAEAMDSLVDYKEILNHSRLNSICFQNASATLQYGSVKLAIDNCSPLFIQMFERNISDR